MKLANILAHLGPRKFPFQRPPSEHRTYVSPGVERIIEDLTSRMTDKDLARMFENCFPNTLDTTVSWISTDPEYPQAFIIAGDMYV